MRSLRLVPILLLLTVPWPITAAQTGPDPSAPWWPNPSAAPVEYPANWNMRIPLLVRNPSIDSLPRGTPIQAALDLGRAALEAGWPASQHLGDSAPASFTADLDSIRLIRYTRDWQAISGEVPYAAFPTWLEPDQTMRYDRFSAEPFSRQRNPVVTIEWILESDLGPSEGAFYYLYFDILENSDKPPAPINEAARERLDGLYWVGKGRVLHGYHPGAPTQAPTLTIISTAAATNVTVYAYHGSTFARVDERPGTGNPKSPFLLAAPGAVQKYSLGLSQTHFRIEADRPVIAAQHNGHRGSGEFVPATDGGLVGSRFLVPPLSRFMYVIAPPDASERTRVCVTPPGASESCIDQDPGSHSLHNLRGSNGQPQPVERLYQVRVAAGPDVLVQFVPDPEPNQPVAAQVPSTLGAPIGRTFMASTLAIDTGRLTLTSHDDTAHARVARAQYLSGDEVYLDAEPIGPPGLPIGIAGSRFPRSDEASSTVPPRPETAALVVQASPNHPGGSGRLQVVVGETGARDIAQGTPFGGGQGVSYHLRGPFVVFPYYPETRIQITHNWDNNRIENRTVGRDTPAEFPLIVDQAASLRSDKPVSVFPLGNPPRYAHFLASKPEFVLPQILPAEYRGYVVRLSTEDGIDPVFINAIPGQTVTIPFHVENLGRWNGQPLSDKVMLEASVEPQALADRIHFERPVVELGGSSSALVRISVELPPETPPATQIIVGVRGTSVGNQKMSSQIGVVIHARQTFDVRAWFGEPESTTGPETHTARLSVGATQVVPFVVKNAGSGTDSIQLTVSNPLGGWRAQLVDAKGTETTRVGPLEAGAQAAIFARITSPSTDAISARTFVIDVVSSASPAAADRLILAARLSLGQGLLLELSTTHALAMPSQAYDFHATATNTGRDVLNVVVELRTDVEAGWAAQLEGAAQSEDNPLTLLPGQRIPLIIHATIPPGALAGQRGTVLLQARAIGEDAQARDAISFVLETKQIHLIRVTPPADLVMVPGSSRILNATITNAGNGPERFLVHRGSHPNSWAIDFPSNVSVPANASPVHFPVTLRIPLTASPGRSSVSLELRAGETSSDLRVNVTVLELRRIGVELENVPTHEFHPHQTGRATIRLENRGNTPMGMHLRSSAPPDWALQISPAAADLSPGASRPFLIEWSVPPQARPGPNVFTVEAWSGAELMQATNLTLHVARPMLRVERLDSAAPALVRSGVQLIHIRLTNDAAVPALGLRVALEENERVLDEATFPSLGPGQNASLFLRWPLDSARAATLVWSQQGLEGVAEGGSMNLERPISAEGEPHPAPMQPLLFLLGLLAIITFRRGGRKNS